MQTVPIEAEASSGLFCRYCRRSRACVQKQGSLAKRLVHATEDGRRGGAVDKITARGIDRGRRDEGLENAKSGRNWCSTTSECRSPSARSDTRPFTFEQLALRVRDVLDGKTN